MEIRYWNEANNGRGEYVRGAFDLDQTVQLFEYFYDSKHIDTSMCENIIEELNWEYLKKGNKISIASKIKSIFKKK